MAGISIFKWRSLEEQAITVVGLNHPSIISELFGENKVIYSMEVISCTGSEWNILLN